jgi:hypothetical protein
LRDEENYPEMTRTRLKAGQGLPSTLDWQVPGSTPQAIEIRFQVLIYSLTRFKRNSSASLNSLRTSAETRRKH